jgi:hypothetical protein
MLCPYYRYVRFEILTAVKIVIVIFWLFCCQCSLVSGNQHFGEHIASHLYPEDGGCVSLSEMLVTTYKTAARPQLLLLC